MDNKDSILTPIQAAKLLKVSLNTMYTSLTNGDIPFIKIGRQYRISRQVIDKMLMGKDKCT